MSSRTKNKEKPVENTKKENRQKLGYSNWLFRKEGTAAEPWPTAKDLWDDPKVKEAIDAHNELVRKKNGTK